MKAKVKATGEIIDVSLTESIITSRGVEKQYVDNKREWCTYVQSELEFINKEPQREIDWEQRRYEIAKEAVRGVALNADCFTRIEIETTVNNALELADLLIAELKKGGDQ